MSILKIIVAKKKEEVAERKLQKPIRSLEGSPFFHLHSVSLAKELLRDDESGIIAEIKRKSPTLGMLHQNIDIVKTAIGYKNAGATGISILTDFEFFGGMNDDLSQAKEKISLPILRKDFIVSEYQIVEARSIGADVILLIANILSPAQVKDFTLLAHDLGMEVLLEVHEEKELDTYCDIIDMVGINNRDLKTFAVTLDTSHRLAKLLPANTIKISESGIKSAEDIMSLKDAGFHGFLIGESFMKHPVPEVACQELIDEVKKKSFSVTMA